MFQPLEISIGAADREPRLVVDVQGYQHPDTVEPADLDLMQCRVSAYAQPVNAAFDMPIALWELFELRDYLAEINSGNGPSKNLMFAGGLLSLSFAPSKRGPVLCAVMLKTIDASHVRLEFLITLEPQDISHTHFELTQLRVHSQK